MEHLFVKYKVDLFVVGHGTHRISIYSHTLVHSYERLYPTINNTRVASDYENPQAPTYIIGVLMNHFISYL